MDIFDKTPEFTDPPTPNIEDDLKNPTAAEIRRIQNDPKLSKKEKKELIDKILDDAKNLPEDDSDLE